MQPQRAWEACQPAGLPGAVFLLSGLHAISRSCHESCHISTYVSDFHNQGNGSIRPGIKVAEGVMKLRESRKNKKPPSRHDYALALKTIRAQFQTIESQSDTIRRQNQFMVMIWMDDRAPAKRHKSQDETEEESASRWIN